MKSECAGKKVLIVEDDKLLSAILLQKFTERSCGVITAFDGEEGIKKFFEEKPDAVIMDITMPRKNGLEVLKEINKRAPQDETPILVLTNTNDTTNIAEAISLKAVAYLVKSDQSLEEIVRIIEDKLCR